MSWREYAKEVQGSGHARHTRHKSPSGSPNVPNVPNVLGASPLDAARALKLVHAGLALVDDQTPLHGVAAPHWRLLVRDAGWLLANFAEKAFRDGWTVGDLFGLWPAKDGWGGLADRLGGSRSLMMTTDFATWRSWGVTEKFARGTYPDLRPFWEQSR